MPELYRILRSVIRIVSFAYKIEEEVVKRTTDRLNEAENRRIEDIISVYHDDLKLSPEEIIRKVADRFGFDPKTAKKHVERVLQSYA